MGGAMDLVSSPDHTKVVVLTDHVDKNGRSKIVQETKLPLTGSRCCSRIITDLCVFDVDRKKGELTLIELVRGLLRFRRAICAVLTPPLLLQMEGVTLDEVKQKTDATFHVGPGVQQ
jgi:3-oxoacid CoA-transferase